MMKMISKAGRRFGMLSSVGIAALIVAAPAMAQDAEDENEEEAKVTTVETDRPEDQGITVTGSRIRLPNLTANEPTNTIDAEYIANRNFTNIADALNDLPQIRGSATPDGAQGSFGQGVNFINNFGLGTNRTLTLINGRRVVSSNTPSLFGPAAPGLQVDLNIVPTALVKRTDIASTAGAPVYGSDAIAGTVNIILDDQYEGLSLIATSSITEEGDGFSYRFEGAYGTSFADNRGHIQVSSFYTQTDGILQSARSVYLDEIETQQNTIRTGRINPNLAINTGAADGVPDTALFSQSRIFALTALGLIVEGPGGITTAGADLDGVFNNFAGAFQFDAGGDLIAFNPGTRPLNAGGASANGIRGINGDRAFQFSDFGQLTSDLRRFGANLFLNYDVTDNINVFVEAQYYDARADELVQQPTFNSTLFGGLSGALTFNLDNPFLSAQARTTLQNAFIRGGQPTRTTFTVARANIGLADLTGFAETELLRGVIGARGDFELGGRGFNWEASFNYGNSDITDFRQDINAQNFINAVNVARNAQGQIVCSTTPTTLAQTPNAAAGIPAPVTDSRCVPLNFFGNQASAAAIDYIIEDSTSSSTLEQIVFNANVGGSPFAIFGNDVGVNVGYEYRKEQGQFTPSEFDFRGRGRGAAITPVGGEFTLNEVFGEVNVPLITPDNDFIIESAIVYGRGRYVDNTINGGFFSWAAGGSIAPVRDIELRGNFTRSFRAPALTELFAPRSNQFGFIPDLCLPQAITAANAAVRPNRERNCAAFLAAFPNISRPQIAAQASVPQITGGNPNLENEQADSWSVGGIIRPWFLPNFSVTVDYINIDISNPIAQLTSAQINSACFDNATFNTADPANGNQFCSLIRREANGEVVSNPTNPGVITGFVNGQSIKYEGIVASALYATKLDGIGVPGTLQLRGDLNVTLFREVNITGVGPQPTHGTIGDEQFVGQVAANYIDKNWGFGSVVNYTGEGLFSRAGRTPDTREFDQLEDYVTVDFNLYFQTSQDFRINFVVNNAFDRRCQVYFGFCIPASINDAFGRTFSASVSKKF